MPDIFGHAADLDAIMTIAAEHGLTVIEDAAQAPGAVYKGRYAGTVGHIGVFSLNCHKHVHTGEGCVCVTNDGALAERLQLIRNHAEAVAGEKDIADLRNMIGFNFRMTEIEAELTTPTGAALLRALCDTIGAPVGIRPRRTGIATGARDLAERPNILRAVLGEPTGPGGAAGSVEVIETTIDDMNPQIYGHLTEALFESGALEVFLTPVQMKKGRPGVLVTALVDAARSAAVVERLFAESTTIGVRVRREDRVELERSGVVVETPLGRVRVKCAILPSGEERRVPEYDDLKRLAHETGRPLVDVMEEVRAFLREGDRARA